MSGWSGGRLSGEGGQRLTVIEKLGELFVGVLKPAKLVEAPGRHVREVGKFGPRSSIS
jgi:hypothetical protein